MGLRMYHVVPVPGDEVILRRALLSLRIAFTGWVSLVVFGEGKENQGIMAKFEVSQKICSRDQSFSFNLASIRRPAFACWRSRSLKRWHARLNELTAVRACVRACVL